MSRVYDTAISNIVAFTDNNISTYTIVSNVALLVLGEDGVIQVWSTAFEGNRRLYKALEQ